MAAKSHSILKRKGYFWVTLALFLVSVVAHWVFGWYAFVDDQQTHGQLPKFSDFSVQAMRDTMENWQSEFLQLIWQVAGLSFLWYTGSPSSKEGDERKEAKIDRILLKLDPDEAEEFIRQVEQKYPRK
jgi:hypothetical protein